MNKIIFIICSIILISFTLAQANVNVTTNIDSNGGDVDFWANPNSGNGTTTYYLDLKLQQYLETSSVEKDS